MPGAYRQVSVADVDVALTEEALVEHFLGRECYRRTTYVVVGNGDGHALVSVVLADTGPLFSPAVAVRVLAGPDETTYVRRPDVDTGVPSQLGGVALEHPGARCVVVEGRYGHVNFLLDPDPVVVRVHEIVPPHPAKLLDQAERVLALAEDLPPMVLVGDLVELDELRPPGGDVLLPCRGSGIDVVGARTWYLDQRPPHQPWTLLGCARSRDIHRWFYGADAPSVDTCPRASSASVPGAVLTKCCLFEDRVELDAGPGGPRAVVPWGASLDQVRDALRALAEAIVPAWAPA